MTKTSLYTVGWSMCSSSPC